MSRLQEKVSAFREHAQLGPVHVNVHNTSRSARANRLVVYACLLASGAGLTVNQLDSITQEHNKARTANEAAANHPERVGPAVLESDQRILRDDRAPRLNYVQVSYAGRQVMTLDEASRIALTKQAAEDHGLSKSGLSWRDVYGVIHAETAWISRDGMGRNGVVSSGLAQLEPNTAKALNVTDPEDPVQAIAATAALMKEAARWSRNRIAGLPLDTKGKAQKLREGVSIYYNLSTRGRNEWNGLNTHELPIETQHHIRNTRDGAQLAGSIEKRLAREGAQQVEQSPYRNASYRGSLNGSDPSILQQIKTKMVAADEYTQAARAVQYLLPTKCTAPSAVDLVIDFNKACLTSQPMRSLPSLSADELSKMLPDLHLLGEIHGVTVFLAKTADIDAFALRLNHTKSEAIMVTQGIVKALEGPGQHERLSFLIGHELAHIRNKDTIQDSAAEGLRQEMRADIGGIQFMRSKGISDEDSAAAGHQVLSVIHKKFEGDSVWQPRLKARMNHLETYRVDQMEAPTLEAKTHPRRELARF